MCENKENTAHGEHHEHTEGHAHQGSGGHSHEHDHKHSHPHCDDHDHGDQHKHDAEHEHEHVHQHAHPHPHSHEEECQCKGHVKKESQCCCGEDLENKDIEILGVLLDHWVAHNQDHAMEYNLWVEKMNRLGKNEVAEDLIEAIALMAEADKHLVEAKKAL